MVETFMEVIYSMQKKKKKKAHYVGSKRHKMKQFVLQLVNIHYDTWKTNDGLFIVNVKF